MFLLHLNVFLLYKDTAVYCEVTDKSNEGQSVSFNINLVFEIKLNIKIIWGQTKLQITNLGLV